LTRTRQPQTGAREAPDHVRAAMEAVEDMGQVVLRDAHTFVAHDEQSGPAFSSIRFLYGDAHRTTVGTVLDGIGQQVSEDAVHARLVDVGLESWQFGVEHELVQLGKATQYIHYLSRERDQLRPSQEQCQRVARLLE